MESNQHTFEGTIELLRAAALESVQRFGRTRRILVAVLLLSPFVVGLLIAGVVVLTS